MISPLNITFPCDEDVDALDDANESTGEGLESLYELSGAAADEVIEY